MRMDAADRARLRDGLLAEARRRTLIMGILNVTPDSFSDGGRFDEAGAALSHADAMVAAGADIIDVGGESTRPGAVPVSEEDEPHRAKARIEQAEPSWHTRSAEKQEPHFAEPRTDRLLPSVVLSSTEQTWPRR